MFILNTKHMRIYKIIILIALLLSVSEYIHSQEGRTEVRVIFRVNNATIDDDYSNNAKCLSEISSFLQSIKQDSTASILKVTFCGSASPEGSYQLNYKLAQARLRALESIVRSKIEIPDSIRTRNDEYISWELLKEQVGKSDLPQKELVLDVIKQKARLVDYSGGRKIDHRIVTLQALEGGKTWKQLHELCFEQMRNACVIFVTYKKERPSAVGSTVECSKNSIAETADTVSSIIAQPVIDQIDALARYLYLKTNVIGLGLAIMNVSAEIDIAKHWSFAIPVYYSALNYFTSTVKFRTLAVQPELRYWLKSDNQKLFVGAHLGYAQYNIATDGDKRYQDHNGNSPALGGGFSIGYRTPISKNEKWHMEITAGAGVYALHYDTFCNVGNGKLIGTHKRTYCGLDNAAINISYRFDLNKRK